MCRSHSILCVMVMNKHFRRWSNFKCCIQMLINVMTYVTHIRQNDEEQEQEQEQMWQKKKKKQFFLNFSLKWSCVFCLNFNWQNLEMCKVQFVIFSSLTFPSFSCRPNAPNKQSHMVTVAPRPATRMCQHFQHGLLCENKCVQCDFDQ